MSITDPKLTLFFQSCKIFLSGENACQENERTSKAERKAEEETIGSEEDNLWLLQQQVQETNRVLSPCQQFAQGFDRPPVDALRVMQVVKIS